ncbi:MAG: hypothetical protein ACM3L6_01025 [Deltaproteobacteria bacterium]
MNTRALRILWDHNFPFLLWSAAAAAKVLLQKASVGTDGYLCPVRFFFGWCPGCGLTHAYGRFLQTGRAPAWFWVIAGLFLLNFFVSLVRARRSLDPRAPKG